jgi:hypothetical protein
VFLYGLLCFHSIFKPSVIDLSRFAAACDFR